MQKKLTTILFAMLLGLGTLSIAACEQDGPAENAGENIDQAAENTQESMSDAGEDMQDSMEDAGDQMEDSVDNNN